MRRLFFVIIVQPAPVSCFFPHRRTSSPSLFNPVDNHIANHILNILYQPIFSVQVWWHILRRFTALLVVFLIFVHPSNVGMLYYPYALVSAIGCVSIPSVRLITTHRSSRLTCYQKETTGNDDVTHGQAMAAVR